MNGLAWNVIYNADSDLLRSDSFAALSWKELPEHLAEIKYRNLSDPHNTAAQLAFRSKTDFFDLLQERLGNFVAFEGLRLLPVKECLLQGFAKHDANAAMFIDAAEAKAMGSSN